MRTIEKAGMRILIALLIVTFGSAVSANAADIRLPAPAKNLVLAANIPEKENAPDKSLMGEERIPDQQLEVPEVFEEPGPEILENEPEGVNELPPSAEDDYLPAVRPKAKSNSKSKRKIKKSKKRGKKRKSHRAKKRSPKWRKQKSKAKRKSNSRMKRAKKVAGIEKRESYRTRRLHEYRNYSDHIIPFGY